MTTEYLEANVWEAFYEGRDITESMQALRKFDSEKAQEVQQEIIETIYTNADSQFPESPCA